MLMRLIIIIVVFALLLAFIAFNLDDNNKCDISFGFTTLLNIPVYLTILSSFVLGLLCALPFAIMRVTRKLKNTQGVLKKPKKEDTTIVNAQDNSSEGESAKRKWRFKVRQNE